MTKKKIGELEGTPIVTGDKNYANEHEYYMTLNGDNTYQKLEQRTNGDKFRLVLGGSGSGSGCTGGATISSIVTPQEATEEQRDAVSAALTAADIDGEATGLFIPAASIDDMPLAIANAGDEGVADVLFLAKYSHEDGVVFYLSLANKIDEGKYIAIDGGFGSWVSSFLPEE